MSINKVFVSGNLTRDPELRTTAGGYSVLGFGLAVNDRRKNQHGEYEDYPNFIDCTIFGTRAEKLEQMLRKGSKVSIEGKLRFSQWEKDGTKRNKLEVVVDDIELMTQKQDQGTPQQYQQQVPRQAQQQVPQQVPQQYQQQAYQQQVIAPQQYQPVQQPVQQQMMQPQMAPIMYDEEIPF